MSSIPEKHVQPATAADADPTNEAAPAPAATSTHPSPVCPPPTVNTQVTSPPVPARRGSVADSVAHPPQSGERRPSVTVAANPHTAERRASATEPHLNKTVYIAGNGGYGTTTYVTAPPVGYPGTTVYQPVIVESANGVVQEAVIVEGVPTTQTIVVVRPSVLVGRTPTRTTCPFCQAAIVTSVGFKYGGTSMLMSLAMCLVGCWPCALLPCCMEGCMEAVHYCPACSNVVGTAGPFE